MASPTSNKIYTGRLEDWRTKTCLFCIHVVFIAIAVYTHITFLFKQSD